MKTLVVDAELAQTEDAYTAATGGAPSTTVRDPWSGKRYGHTWVEDDGYVYDWQTSVGLGTGKPRTYAAFYDLYQPEQLRFFDTTAAAVNALRHRHYGPW